MKHRIVSGLLLVPLAIVLTTTPAYAIFGSILAGIQRAQMIANQGIQIYNDAMEKITMNGQLTELTGQFSHLKEQALGTVGALTQPFTDLSSIPAEFIRTGLSWKDDFTGVAGELAGAVEQLGESGTSFTDAWSARLTASNTISESDFLSLYAGQSPEVGAAALFPLFWSAGFPSFTGEGKTHQTIQTRRKHTMAHSTFNRRTNWRIITS